MRKEEITILKCLESKLNEGIKNNSVRDAMYFINGFIAAARIITLEMKALPSKEFLKELENMLEEDN